MNIIEFFFFVNSMKKILERKKRDVKNEIGMGGTHNDEEIDSEERRQGQKC